MNTERPHQEEGSRKAVRPRTYLGFPVGVAWTTSLPGTLSEQGWDCLVEDLRETFQARGEVWKNEGQRRWRNGYLRVSVEPAGPDRDRLRMKSLKGTARHALTRGLAFVAVGSAILLFQGASGGLAWNAATAVAALALAAGLAGAGATARQLPRWRAERRRQMEAIAERTAQRMTPPTAEEVASSRAPRRPHGDDALPGEEVLSQ